MPASTLDSVTAALRTSLTKNQVENVLDSQLVGATKKALLTNVEFEPAGSYQSTVLDKLKTKYIILKSVETNKASSKPEEDMDENEGLKVAKCALYPIEAVQLGWNNCDWSVGAGMVNMGNTCYLNSTLQALFHVPALANWLMSDKEHAVKCQDLGVSCIICAMRKTLLDSQRNSNSIRPILIYNKLRLVCRNLIPGRQEDAHEFLRCLVEAMEKAYLNRFKNHSEFDSRTKETTPLNQILGGYLHSAVRCLECGHVSTTFQHFQDLLLDIRKVQTLDEALEGYFSREKLDDESYHCESCKKRVQATKQFSLEKAPMVLCIQLKRFSVTNNKITKHIVFRQRLDMNRYVRHRPTTPLVYRLVALVTHMGPTVSCGHYTAVAQAPSGNFYQFDDSMVKPISHQAVFSTNAYIMLYELESPLFLQKSLGVNKVKAATGVTEPKHCTVTTPKSFANGLTGNIYGPELPPGKVVNGVVPTSYQNGNGNVQPNPPNSETSSSEKEPSLKVVTETQSPVIVDPVTTTSAECSQKPPSSSKVVNSESSELTVSKPASCSPPKNKIIVSYPQAVTRLVPYETDDSTNSDDSVQANEAASVQTTVSTKAASDGDWQITSSSDITNDSNYSPSKSWEKKKSPSENTVTELYKMSHSGYAASVSTWNGSKAQLTKEVMNERREERKRAFMDDSDQGRVKHQKMSNNYKPSFNPVQEYHNSKNNWNQNMGGHYKQFYPSGNRHRRNFHHNKFQKNYRCRQ